MKHLSIALVVGLLISNLTFSLSIFNPDISKIQISREELSGLGMELEENRLHDLYQVLIKVPNTIGGSEYSGSVAKIYAGDKEITEFSVSESLASEDGGNTFTGKVLHISVNHTIVSEIDLGIMYGNTIYKLVLQT